MGGPEEKIIRLYRAALSGPLREDTREDVKSMLNACLASLDHQRLGNDSIHLSPRWG